MSDLAAVNHQSDAALRSAFYRSVTLLVSIAAIILSGSEGTLFPSGLTPVFAVIGWIAVDHQRWLRVPLWLGNLLALTALSFAVYEFLNGQLLDKLFAGAHLIVYLMEVVESTSRSMKVMLIALRCPLLLNCGGSINIVKTHFKFN